MTRSSSSDETLMPPRFMVSSARPWAREVAAGQALHLVAVAAQHLAVGSRRAAGVVNGIVVAVEEFLRKADRRRHEEDLALLAVGHG